MERRGKTHRQPPQSSKGSWCSHVQALNGLQGRTSLIFSQIIQDKREKDALGPACKCVGGSPPDCVRPCSPASIWPILQSSTKSQGWIGAPDIGALCGQHMSLQRQAGPLPRCSLPRDTGNRALALGNQAEGEPRASDPCIAPAI